MDKFKGLKSLVSRMKVNSKPVFLERFTPYGNSEYFTYAISQKKQPESEPENTELRVWQKLLSHDLRMSKSHLPLNGFEEMIQLTEQGRLWRFPIDNEQGLEAEKEVPFEEHVFLDDHLKDLPDDEYIRSFMKFVTAGLARNHTMTVDRKVEIINFYKQYFEEKRDIYKEAGYDISV